jgi:hypothetical protein
VCTDLGQEITARKTKNKSKLDKTNKHQNSNYAFNTNDLKTEHILIP